MKTLAVLLTLVFAAAVNANEADARVLRAKAAAAAVVTAWDNAPLIGPMTAAISDRIHRIKETDAWRSGKPLWLHFGDSTNCAPCDRAEEMMGDAAIVAESRVFACVAFDNDDQLLRERIRDYGVSSFPTDVFISADRQTAKRFEGCPKTVALYVARLQEMGKAMAAAE